MADAPAAFKAIRPSGNGVGRPRREPDRRAADVWERRHRGILTLLWLHVIGIPFFGVAQGYGIGHSLLEGGLIAVPALLASFGTNRKLRAALVSVGLLTSSALLVHFPGGYIEANHHVAGRKVVHPDKPGRPRNDRNQAASQPFAAMT